MLEEEFGVEAMISTKESKKTGQNAVVKSRENEQIKNCAGKEIREPQVGGSPGTETLNSGLLTLGVSPAQTVCG